MAEKKALPIDLELPEDKNAIDLNAGSSPISAAVALASNLFSRRTAEAAGSGFKAGGSDIASVILDAVNKSSQDFRAGLPSNQFRGKTTEFNNSEFDIPDRPDLNTPPEITTDPRIAKLQSLMKTIEEQNNYSEKFHSGENLSSLIGKLSKSGDVKDLQNLSDYAVNGVARQIPIMVGMAAGTMAGMGPAEAAALMGGFGMASQSKGDRDRGLDLDENDRTVRAGLSGAMNAATGGVSAKLMRGAINGTSVLETMPIVGQHIAKATQPLYSALAKTIGSTHAAGVITRALENIFGQGADQAANQIGHMVMDEHYNVQIYTTKQKIDAAIEAFGINALAAGIITDPFRVIHELNTSRAAVKKTGNPALYPPLEKLVATQHIIERYKTGLPGSQNPQNQPHVVDADVILAQVLATDMFANKQFSDSGEGHGTLEILGAKMREHAKSFANERGAVTLPDAETLENTYQRFFNRFQSIENLSKRAKKLGIEVRPGEDPGLLGRSYLGIAGKAQSFLEDKTFYLDNNGNIKITGEGLKPILERYDQDSPERNYKTRAKDLRDYLIAKRTDNDLQRPAYEGGDNIATPEQVEKARADIKRLSEKYGADISFLEFTAKRLYDYQKRVLETQVFSGNMAPERFGAILKENPNYVPFDRVIENEEGGGVPRSKSPFSGARSPVKKIKGSDLEIHDPIESIIKNTYRILETSDRNRVANAVAGMMEYFPDEIKPVDPKMIPVANEEFTVQTDPVLKAKLKQVIDNLHGKFAEKFHIGGKGRLGYYVHPHNDIVTKIGSREDVLAHELGHFLDFTYGLASKLVRNPETNKELRTLADQRYEGSPVTQGFKKYVREESEKVAALIDAYITKPYLVDEYAPKSKAVIDQLINEHPELAPLKGARPGLRIGTETFNKQIWRESPFKPKGNVIEYYKDGKKQYMEVTPNLYAAMNGMNEGATNAFTKLLSIPAQSLRRGATLTPEFIARNIIKDQFSAFINDSKTPLSLKTLFGVLVQGKGSLKAAKEILRKEQTYYDWLRAGGAYSGFVELKRADLKEHVQQLLNKKGAFQKVNFITRLEDLSQLMERATRVGAYKRAIQNGASSVEAAVLSRDATTDFGRRGSDSFMKELNKVDAFFNASMQGMDRSIRAIKEDPIGVAMRGISSITIPSIALFMINKDDEEYWKKPKWQRDLFWMGRIPGTDRFWMIPKGGFFYGQVFGTVPERFLEAAFKKNPKALDGLLRSTLASLSPIGDDISGLLPTAIKPFVEWWANKSFFTSGPLIPQARERMIPSEQYDRRTTQTAKAIGRASNFSPAILENFVKNWTGASGSYFLQAGDRVIDLIRKVNGATPLSNKPFDIAGVPLIRGFVTKDSSESSDELRRFYSNRDQIAKIYFSARDIYKQGRQEDAEELVLGAKFRDFQHIKSAQMAFNQAVKTLKECSNRIDKIENSTTINADEKRRRIKKGQAIMAEIASEMNEKYAKVKAGQAQKGA